MAAVLEKKPDPAGTLGSQVDEQIAQAASRIRVHDMALGALVLGALILAYAVGMILLDKYLVLAEWVRQLTLGGLVVTALGVGYWLIVRPLRRDVNPLYAAVQVERTLDDAKNSVAGYVDARERGDVHPAVQAAMSARAARTTRDADLNQAIDHRPLVYAALIAVAFLLTLIVLFFLFRPAQFGSLFGRTFAPFSSSAIATRTQIDLLAPKDGNVTITSGQSLSVKVEIGGRLPNPDSPEQLRVLFRQNPAAPYSEVPLVEVKDRVWQAEISARDIGNGIWYKVVGGDAETPEYAVTVQSIPLVQGVDVHYEYPNYLRKKPETATYTRPNPRIEATAGTRVTLTARTNRDIQGGRLAMVPAGDVPGHLVSGDPTALRFSFTLKDDGTYRILFTTTAGEQSPDSTRPGDIKAIPDRKPEIVVNSPPEDEIPLPANDILKVDAAIGDDFGIDGAVLKMRIVHPVKRQLADKPYWDGKSFRRQEPDGGFTWPRNVEYKDSVDLANVTTPGPRPGVPGERVVLEDKMVIEYWVEATDNRHELVNGKEVHAPNIGRSKVKRIVLTPPKVRPEDKQQIEQDKQDRQAEENKHNEQQQKKFDKEDRRTDQQNGNKGEQGQPQPKDGNTEPKEGGDRGQPKKEEQPDKKEPANTPKEPAGKQPDSKQQPGGKTGEPSKSTADPKGGKNGMNNPDTQPKAGQPMEQAPPPRTPEQRQTEKQADQVQDAINQEKDSGGSAKGNPSAGAEKPVDPSQPKPKDGDQPQNAPKPETKPGDPMGEKDAAQQKPAGNLQQQPDPSAPKPEPKNDAGTPMNPQTGAAQQKPEPKPNGANPATDKPPPQPKPEPKKEPGAGGMPEPKDTNKDPNQDPNGGGVAKPAKPGEKPKPKAGGQPNHTDMEPGDQPKEPQDPAAGAGQPKPKPENGRGTEKPSDNAAAPKSGPPDANRGDQQAQNGGDAKPQQPPEPGTSKPAPKGGADQTPKAAPKPGQRDGMAGKQPDSGAAEPKPDGTKPPGGGMANDRKPVDKGVDKPTPDRNTTANGSQPQPKEGPDGTKGPKEPKSSANGMAQKQMDPKDALQAAKDLNSPDKSKQEAARKKLDDKLGEQNRKEIEKQAGDLNSADKDKKAAAEKKVEDIANKANREQAKGGPAGEPKPKVDPKDVQQAIDDLKSGDPAKKEAARRKLDEQLGKGAGDKAEEALKDAQNPDKNKQAEGQKKLDNLKQQAEQLAKNQQAKSGPEGQPDPKQKGQPDPKQKGKELTKKEVDDLVKKAGDLTSEDPKKREAAEQEFDQKLGKENREKIQDALKKQQNQKGTDEQAAKEARKRVEEMANKGEPKDDGRRSSPGQKPETINPALEDNPANRLKSAELQLEKFKRNKDNKEVLDRLKWTPEQYEEFLRSYEKEVDRLRAEATKPEVPPELPVPPGPPTGNVNDGGRVGARQSGGPGSPMLGGGGGAFVPPGFDKALEGFRKDATKIGGSARPQPK